MTVTNAAAARRLHAGVSAAAFLAAAFLAAGCGRTPSSGPPAAGDGSRVFRVAVIPKGTSHEFWQSVRAGAELADREFEDVEVTWKGPLSEGDTDDQIEIVESFIANGYDGICLAPLDAVALRKAVDEALRQKIAVLTFDSALRDPSGTVSYVATNNYRGGQKAGDYLAELLGGQGKIILMRYALNSESTEQREAGFLEAVGKHPGLELLVQDKYAGPEERGALELGEILLSNYGDRVQGIFCPNQSTASGMLTALERDPRGLAGRVKLVGFDAGANIVRGLESGQLNGTILQDPVKMGYEAVATMVKHLRGEQVPPRIETEETLATTENRNEPRIRELLFPAQR